MNAITPIPVYVSAPSIAALRAITGANAGSVAFVAAFANAGDGGGGTFVYDAADTTTPDNGGTIIAPAATLTGRWYRQFSGPLDIRWFGGVADWNGTTGTDNLPALTAAVAALSVGTGDYIGGPHIKYPGAPLGYWHSGTYFFKKNVIVEGDSSGFPFFTDAYPTTLVFPKNLGTPAFKFERYNTLNNQIISPTTSGADGSFLRNLLLISAPGATYDSVSHGVDTRCRIGIDNVSVIGFGGHGVQILANSGGTGPTQGNANEWYVNLLNCEANQGDAFHIEGPDANGGSSVAFGCISSGHGGLVDITFLGNTHSGWHIDGCNSAGLGRVNYNGGFYDLINYTAGIGSSTTPGTNNAIWYLVGYGAGGYPVWNAANTYYVSSSVYSNNPNSSSTFLGGYIEGGYPIAHVAGPAIVYTSPGLSNFAFTYYSHVMNGASSGGAFRYTAGTPASGYISMAGGQPTPGDTVTINGDAIAFVASGATGLQCNIGASAQITATNLAAVININTATLTVFAVVDNAVNTQVDILANTAGIAGNAIALAVSSGTVTISGAVLSGGVSLKGTYQQVGLSALPAVGSGIAFTDQGDITWRFGQDLSVPGFIELEYLNSVYVFSALGETTANYLGKSNGGVLTQYNTGIFPAIALGNSSTGRQMTSGTAAPTTGYHAIGEIVFNTGATAAGQVLLWYCTVAGTPGTWVAHNL